MPTRTMKPAAKKPAAKKSAKRPAARKPAAKKTAKKPAAKKPAAKKTAKRPAAKKLAAKKSAVSKPKVGAAVGEALDKLPPGESEAAFRKFVALARADEAPVERYRGGALLMLANVRRGVEALRGREAELAAHLPKLDRAAMWSASELALAVGFAARAAQLESSQESQLPAIMSRVYVLRDLLLTNAEGLARAELMNRAEVDKIRAGLGKTDAAQDCVDLAALYRRHAAALRGKTPVSADKVREAAEAGAAALKLLRPARSPKNAVEQSETARDRDRLYTLLLIRHRELRRAGMYLWLDDVDAHVPALLAREGARRTKKQPAPRPDSPPADNPPPA